MRQLLGRVAYTVRLRDRVRPCRAVLGDSEWL